MNIKTKQGKTVIIDDWNINLLDDYTIFTRLVGRVSKEKRQSKVFAKKKKGSDGGPISLARLIMNATNDEEVFYETKNCLDCRESNLYKRPRIKNLKEMESEKTFEKHGIYKDRTSHHLEVWVQTSEGSYFCGDFKNEVPAKSTFRIANKLIEEKKEHLLFNKFPKVKIGRR